MKQYNYNYNKISENISNLYSNSLVIPISLNIEEGINNCIIENISYTNEESV